MARCAIIAAGPVLAAGEAAAQVTLASGADFAVETFGYGRAGFGWTVGEGAQTCFRALGAAEEVKPTGGAFFDRPRPARLCGARRPERGAGSAGVAPQSDGCAGMTVGMQIDPRW
jgi:hypothetical protein